MAGVRESTSKTENSPAAINEATPSFNQAMVKGACLTESWFMLVVVMCVLYVFEARENISKVYGWKAQTWALNTIYREGG